MTQQPSIAGNSGTSAGDRTFFSRTGLPIGMQLFPLTPQLRDNLDGTLGKIAAMGYDMIETAGLLDRSAAEFRQALDRAGLACGGMHVPGQSPFGPGQNLAKDIDAIIADAQVLGAGQIVMPLFFFPEGLETPPDATPSEKIRLAAAQLSPEEFRRMADFLNEKGRYLAEHGLRLSYHNHNAEFAPQGETSGYEMLLDLTDPAYVDFQLDIGWAATAGIDIPQLLARHPGRITQMHLKDIAPTTQQNFLFRQDPSRIGEGTIDFATILPLAYEAGTRGFFVEQEAPFVGDPLDDFAANYRTLSELRA